MIRHIFIGTFKPGISDDIKQKELMDMKAMKDRIPGIVAQEVGLSTGWEGQKNQIVMMVDFKTKADFDVYMAHPYHREYIDKTLVHPDTTFNQRIPCLMRQNAIRK